MGTFNFPTLIHFIGSYFDVSEKESTISIIQSFKTKYLNDPWVLPNPSNPIDDNVYSDSTPILYIAEIAYQAIQQDTANTDPPQAEEEDPLIQPVWAVNSFASWDCLDMVLSSDGAIMEA